MRNRYKKDPDRPTCLNINCDNKVHLIEYRDKKYPIYRSVCENCHYGNIEGKFKTHKYKQGVIVVKKNYCENYIHKVIKGIPKDKRIECCTEHNKEKINSAKETGVLPSRDLHIDHIDGDHYNNVPENVQTLCSACHTYKTQIAGDHKSRGTNMFIRHDKVEKKNLNIEPIPIEHDFWD